MRRNPVNMAVASTLRRDGGMRRWNRRARCESHTSPRGGRVRLRREDAKDAHRTNATNPGALTSVIHTAGAPWGCVHSMIPGVNDVHLALNVIE